MDTYKSYTERILQPTPVILGLRMLPFTLGMAMLLKAADSKFMNGGFAGLTDKEVITELVFACLVCSTSYDAFKAEIHSGEFERYVKKYVAELTEEISETKGGFNLLSRISLFANYLKDGTQAPLYIVKESKDSEISSNPIEAEEAIISTLMTECGYTRDECLNLPLVETLSAYLLYAYKQGTIDLISRDVAELMKGKR